MNAATAIQQEHDQGSSREADPYSSAGRGEGCRMRLFGQVGIHRDLAIGFAVSVLFHVGLFAWRGHAYEPPQKEEYDLPARTLELVKLPTYEEEVPDISEVETIRPAETVGSLLAPPTQSDFPQVVRVDSFVQPVQPPAPRGAEIVATTKIFHGGWGTSDQLEVFDPSSLDQVAVPTLQLRPDYPESLRRNGIEGRAVVEFIVDTKGRVRNARCIRATEPDFGLAAVYGVRRWRFKPGKKSGRVVNTRIRQLILFDLNGL